MELSIKNPWGCILELPLQLRDPRQADLSESPFPPMPSVEHLSIIKIPEEFTVTVSKNWAQCQGLKDGWTMPFTACSVFIRDFSPMWRGSSEWHWSTAGQVISHGFLITDSAGLGQSHCSLRTQPHLRFVGSQHRLVL